MSRISHPAPLTWSGNCSVGNDTWTLALPSGDGQGGFFGLLTSAGGAAGDEERRCKGEKAYGLDVPSKYFRVNSQDYLRFTPAVRCVMGVLVLVRRAD